jgi:hypothetical protein
VTVAFHLYVYIIRVAADHNNQGLSLESQHVPFDFDHMIASLLTAVVRIVCGELKWLPSSGSIAQHPPLSTPEHRLLIL